MSDPISSKLQLDTILKLPNFTLKTKCNINLDEVTGLFGPSGSGKSTLLRIISGIEKRSTGNIIYKNSVWQNSKKIVPAYLRPVGYVFQNSYLFDHLNVEGNLRYAEFRRLDKNTKGITFDMVVSAFDLKSLLNRDILSVSGGEKQRIAIARTLLSNPSLLLLDEPLTALDIKHKKEIFPYLKSLYKTFGIPMIYVSHSIKEMGELTDRMIVIENGKIKTIGLTHEVLSKSGLDYFVDNLSPVSMLKVKVSRILPQFNLTEVLHKDQKIMIPGIDEKTLGSYIRIIIRASDVVLSLKKPENLSVRNIIHGKVENIKDFKESPFAFVSIDIGESSIISMVTNQAISDLGIEVGLNIYALIKTTIFNDEF